MPDNAGGYLNLFNKNKIIEEIEKYRKHCDQVFLCLQWGGKVERGYYPDWEQPAIARELIENGIDGFLVEPFAIDQIINQIITLINNEDARKRIGIKAAAKIKERFGIEKMISNYISLYNEIR